ncbi:MAG: hypothetical protein U0M42_03250 [Acutalibacteraceae bacterium]|nr:hypothetical protein [Acutalibacteraceae bacterium]
MKIKGITKALAVLFAFILCLTGCKGEEKLTVTDISNSLCELCLKGKETYEVSKADIENRFNFDGNLLDQCSIKLCDNDQEFLMVAVFSLKENADKTAIINGINAAVKEVSGSFSVLGNKNLAKIQQRIFYEYEDIQIVVICEDYTAVKKYFEDIGATPIQ